jgi:hypothetical protein
VGGLWWVVWGRHRGGGKEEEEEVEEEEGEEGKEDRKENGEENGEVEKEKEDESMQMETMIKEMDEKEKEEKILRESTADHGDDDIKDLVVNENVGQALLGEDENKNNDGNMEKILEEKPLIEMEMEVGMVKEDI